MKSWKLDSQQRVSADMNGNVYFKHYIKGKRKGVTLSHRQFLNLNDIIKDLKTFQNMKYYPLGKKVWLQYDADRFQLYHCSLNIYFTFHHDSWHQYINRIHHQISSFLHHVSSLYDRKHAASHETLFQVRSGKVTSKSSKQQTISRETSDVGGEHEQWSKCANVSKWNDTNPGPPFSFIGAVHALGTTENASTNMEEGEVHDVESDCEQHGDFYSIE